MFTLWESVVDGWRVVDRTAEGGTIQTEQLVGGEWVFGVMPMEMYLLWLHDEDAL